VRAAVVPAEPASAAAAVAAPAVAPAAAPAAVLFFGTGSSALAGDAGQTMAPLLAALTADPNAKVTLSGYHSASGSLAQNQELAKRRAFAVRDALKAAGVAEDRIVLQKPQTAEANLSGEDPKARRVELAVR
jgi:photosynthetic reaction center cytochrome c subunit